MRCHVRVLLVAAALVAAVASRAAAAAYDWPQFDGDSRHSGDNRQETILGPGNVGRLSVLFRVRLPDVADGAAAYLSNVETPAGERDLLFLTTRAGHIVALDALTGKQLWSRQYGPGGLRINNGFRPIYTTASPAVDPDRQFVYSYGLDGYVHKYQVTDGEEVKGGGWPELTTLKSFNEKGSSDLTVATDRDGGRWLYVAHGGYPGDRGDYQGHLTTIDLRTGAQRVFNANSSDRPVHFRQAPESPDSEEVQSAIWARGGVVYDEVLDRIFTATGNGPFDPRNHDWGDTVFALRPDGTGEAGHPLDSYTPQNNQELNDTDTDLGSTLPAVLPVFGDAAGGPRLAVQGGKDSILRILDLRFLSGRGGIGHTGGELSTTHLPQGGEILTQPAAWRDPSGGAWLFVANGRGISGLQLVEEGGKPRLVARWTDAAGGTSPLVANGVLYCAGSSHLRAMDPRTGRVLWEDPEIGRIHWESPIVANGRLYLTTEDGLLICYGLAARQG